MDTEIPPNMAQLAQLEQAATDPGATQPPGNEPQPSQTGDDLDDEGMIAEAQRGLDGIKTALYKDRNVSDQFLSMIKPDKKEDSVTRAAILLVTELDKKMDLDETVLAPMTAMAAGELMELSEAGHGIVFSEDEQRRVVMAAFEGILQAYQVDPQEAANFVAAVGPEAEQQGVENYKAALNG